MVEFVAWAVPVLWWALVGATVASGSAAISGRVKAKLSVNDRSRCACGRPLTPTELIPVWSWLRVGGRSRCCRARIPSRLLWGEVFGASVTAAAATVWGWPGGVTALVLTAGTNAVPAWWCERRPVAAEPDASQA
jgi:leader peptidase (prepilin peptidase)/N-methyltransferase